MPTRRRYRHYYTDYTFGVMMQHGMRRRRAPDGEVYGCLSFKLWFGEDEGALEWSDAGAYTHVHWSVDMSLDDVVPTARAICPDQLRWAFEYEADYLAWVASGAMLAHGRRALAKRKRVQQAGGSNGQRSVSTKVDEMRVRGRASFAGLMQKLVRDGEREERAKATRGDTKFIRAAVEEEERTKKRARQRPPG